MHILFYLHQVFCWPLWDDVWGYFGERLAVIMLQRSLVSFFPGGYSQWATLANGEICASADPRNKKQVYVLFYVVTCHLNCRNTHSMPVFPFLPLSLLLSHTCIYTHGYVLSKRWRTEGGASTARSWMTLRSITQRQEAQREGGKDDVGRTLIFTVERVTDIERCWDERHDEKSFRGENWKFYDCPSGALFFLSVT